MKKFITGLWITTFSFGCFAQSNSILLRHDTTQLKALECEWVIKALIKIDPSLISEIGKSVPLIILQAIERGKLKATDPLTNKIIPAKEIFTWKMPRDTMMVADANGNYTKQEVIQRKINSDDITQLRIFQDWYFDIATGKIQSQIESIELLILVYTPAGHFIGNKAICRIHY